MCKCTMKNKVNHAHIYTSQHLYMVNHATIMRRIPAWLWFREPSVRTSGETILNSRTPTQARFQPVSYYSTNRCVSISFQYYTNLLFIGRTIEGINTFLCRYALTTQSEFTLRSINTFSVFVCTKLIF